MDPQNYPGQQQPGNANVPPTAFPGGQYAMPTQPMQGQQPLPPLGGPIGPMPMQPAPQSMQQAMPPMAAPQPQALPQQPVAMPQQQMQAPAMAQQSVPLPAQAMVGGVPQTVPPAGKGAASVQKRNLNSTQNTLLISEIRDNIVIMSDGGMRAIVACRSINFDLMSAREREGVEYGYQSFLNSLYFAVQILIRSQRVDIGPYLQKLSKLRRDQDNMLLGVLMDDYIDFIATISEETNIMDKQFYVVVPFYPTGDLSSAVNTSKNLFAGIAPTTKQAVTHIPEASYQKAKDELQNRVMTVINGLLQMGVHSTRLDTKRLGELYYNVYNPDTAVREPLGSFDTSTPPIAIRKGTGEAPQPHLERESA